MAGLFRNLSPGAARLRSLLSRRARGLPFEAGGAAWTFSSCGGRVGAGALAAYGSIGSSELSVWLDGPGWRLAAGTVLAVRPEDTAALSPSLIQAALECFFSDALARLEKALGLPLALVRTETAAPPPPAAAHPFRLVREDGLAVNGAWTAPDGEWYPVLEQALLGVVPPQGPIPDTLLLEGIIAAGRWRVPVKALRGVEAGDVVLAPRGEIWSLTVGRRYRFAARFEKGILVADGAKATDTAADSLVGDASTGAEAPVLVDVGEAEIELRAEVGRLGVTVAELRRLSVGEVVEFATEIGSPATLVAGGRPIATGELVDVGGRVGVRITEMAEGKRKNA